MNSILIIDDQASVRKLLSKILQRHSYTVFDAADSKTGLEILNNEDIDLIILDVMLEDEVGYDVCRQYKENDTISHIPIIFLTASEASTALKEAYEAGGVDFIEKPVESGSLLMRIKSHFSQIEARKKVQQQHEELKAYQAILIQEEKVAAVSRMVGGLSHELNNPLACIKSNFHSLGKYLSRIATEIQSLPKELNTIQTRCERSLRNCRDIVEESGEEFLQLRSITDRLVKLDLPPDEEQSYSINEAVKTAINLNSDDLTDCTVSLDLQEVPDIICHPASITESINGLLDNAIRSLQDRPEKNISISTHNDKENIFLEIKDSGCGIPEDIIDKIWDPFFTTRDIGKGAGLGLSSMTNMLKNIQGSITAESSVGQGSLFKMRIPI